MTPLSQRIKHHREKAGLTAPELAERAGVTPGYIYMLERDARGKRPTLDLARRLARALEVSVDELLSADAPGTDDGTLEDADDIATADTLPPTEAA